MFDWWINITKCLLCFSLFRWNMCQMSVQETEEGKFLHICSFSPHFYVETNVIVVKHNTNATFYNRTVNMDELSKTFLFTNPCVCISAFTPCCFTSHPWEEALHWQVASKLPAECLWAWPFLTSENNVLLSEAAPPNHIYHYVACTNSSGGGFTVMYVSPFPNYEKGQLHCEIIIVFWAEAYKCKAVIVVSNLWDND